MFGYTKLAHWLRNLFHKDRVQSEMDEELAFHLEMEIENNMKRGMNPKAARQAALRGFGGVAQIQEECRDVRFGTVLETAWQDVRYGARMLRRNLGFTCAAVLTLALGIGANTAIFSVVNGVLFRPLPYPEPENLVYLQEKADSTELWPSGSTYAAWRDQNRSLSQIAAYFDFPGNLTGHGEAERISYGKATVSLLPLLGVRPVIGRNFLPQEDRPGGAPVALLSHALWQRRFRSDASVLGQVLSLDGKNYTIIGVLPADFQIADRYQHTEQLWVPFAINEADRLAAWRTFTHVIGRIKPGVSPQQATSELGTILQATLSARQKTRHWQATVTPWHDVVAGGARLALLMFMVAVGFVLLIACVNVANLLLARAAARQQEIAVRRALGAGKGRIVRQLLTESVLLALLGGAIGLALAFWGKNLLVTLIARDLPALPPMGIDHTVLGFNLALALVTGVAFGLAPALHVTGTELNESLKEAGRGAVGGRRRHYLRSILVVSEVALATVLLLGAGLLLKSFLRARGIDPGFKRDSVLLMSVSLTESKYPKPTEQALFFQQVGQRVQALGAVESVGLTACPPLGLAYMMTGSGLAVEGRPDQEIQFSYTTASTEYFRTLGIHLLRGRSFTDGDGPGMPSVAVVNQAFVRRFFPNEEPLGRRIETPFHPKDWLTIVGVVGDVRQNGLDEEVSPVVYRSYLQAGTSTMSVVVRTVGDPMKLAAALRGQVASVDRDQPAHDIMTIDDGVASRLSTRRTNTLLLGTFAALALALASVGIYGVVAYNVEERTHEIGIRIALGATRARVLQMIVGRGVVLAVLGIALGLAAALAMTRLISTLLFGVTATDLGTFALVPLLMAATVLLATYLPSRRAASIDPMVALRCE